MQGAGNILTSHKARHPVNSEQEITYFYNKNLLVSNQSNKDWFYFYKLE